MQAIGTEVCRYNDVSLFENGPEKDACHGRHFSANGYYFGQKWQCVEFVKRYYYLTFDHPMPDVWGHARDFFDVTLPHRGYNPRRNLVQFCNGRKVKPEIDDILVFSDSEFGHLAIIAAVGIRSIDVVQQNIPKQPRQTFSLLEHDGTYRVTAPRKPDGWLRKSS